MIWRGTSKHTPGVDLRGRFRSGKAGVRLVPHWSAAYIWACPSGPFAPLLGTTLVHAEKVRPQFLSLRQLGRSRVFSARPCWQLSPAAAAISHLRLQTPNRQD